MHYMHSKSNADASSGKKKTTDLMDIIAARLTGDDLKVPRKKTAYNVWGPLHRHIVDPVFNKRVKESGISASQHIALRSAIYKELFAELPHNTQDRYNMQAIQEHEQAEREARKKAAQPASTKPHDRQM